MPKIDLQGRLCRWELERDAVDAMSFIGGSTKTFSFENMTKMATACCTIDLYSSPIWVCGSGDGTRDSIKECRPATTCVELCGWFVKRSLATCTAVDSFFVEINVFSGSWIFGAFLTENPKLLRWKNRTPLLLSFLHRSRSRRRHVRHESIQLPPHKLYDGMARGIE